MKKSQELSINTIAAHAADNAAAAALAASESVKVAADNAMVAAKAAAESATTIAVVATDTSWMKKSLEGIEITLNEMSKAFVTAVQHQEAIKMIDDHETRVRSLEQRTWIWVGGLMVLIFAVPIFLKIFFKI